VVLNVSSTGCNKKRQSFPKLSCSAIDNVLTNLLPAGLQHFFQVLNVTKATAVNKLLECSPDRIIHWIYVWVFAPHPFSTRKARINALSSLVNGCIFTFTSTMSAMTSHRILIIAEYLNAHFFFVFLFVFAQQV